MTIKPINSICTLVAGSLMLASMTVTAATTTTTTTTSSSELLRRLTIVKQTNKSYSPSVINLSWNIPSMRISGAPLSGADISGYDLSYIGRATGKSGVVHITGGTQTSYKFSSLSPDTYDFAISAYDIKGISSPMSNIVTIKVP